MIETGVLALVVGPSGAGKDTLIGCARRALDGDQRFAFCRRVVTPPAIDALEDHDTLDPAAFTESEQSSRFFLSWRAHGLGYALPQPVVDALRAGRVVIANVSRSVIDAAEARARNVVVFSITSPPDVLAERLAVRGRESAEGVAARLRRSVGVVAARAPVVEIDNSGAVSDAAAVLIRHLRSLPEPPVESAR